MVKITYKEFPNKDFYVMSKDYKAVANLEPRRGEYHFSLRERGKGNEWIYIATYSDKNFLRLIGDIVNAIVEFQSVADKIDADKQRTNSKPPL